MVEAPPWKFSTWWFALGRAAGLRDDAASAPAGTAGRYGLCCSQLAYLRSQGQAGRADLAMTASAGFTVEGSDELTLPAHRGRAAHDGRSLPARTGRAPQTRHKHRPATQRLNGYRRALPCPHKRQARDPRLAR